MSKEKDQGETGFDTLRKGLSLIAFGFIAVGAAIGSAGMVAGGLLDIALDKTVGKEVSNKLKKMKTVFQRKK